MAASVDGSLSFLKIFLTQHPMEAASGFFFKKL
jgi:hypothetical protein